MPAASWTREPGTDRTRTAATTPLAPARRGDILDRPMHDAPTPLPPGRFFGVNCSERQVGGTSGLVLSETVYQPSQRIPRHAHERAYFAYLVGGDGQDRGNGPGAARATAWPSLY